MRVLVLLLVLPLLSGCVETSPSPVWPTIEVGDYWVYGMYVDDELVGRYGAQVQASVDLDGTPAFAIASWLEGDVGSLQASIRWVDATQGLLGGANEFDLTGPRDSAWSGFRYQQPCPQVPDLELGAQRTACTQVSTALNATGGIVRVAITDTVHEQEVHGPGAIVVDAGSFDAWEVTFTDAGELGTQWFAPAACGLLRQEFRGLRTEILGVRCAGKQHGMALEDSGLAPVPTADGTPSTTPWPFSLGCDVRSTGVRANGMGQDLFVSPCTALDATPVDDALVVGTLHAEATWSDDESVIRSATLQVGDATASGSSPPLAVTLNDVAAGELAGLEPRLVFDGVSNAPPATITFTFDGLHQAAP